jgi:aminoglycoside 6'-N-acetyltransferase
LRALTPADGPELLRLHREPAVAEWWGAPGPDFPDEDPSAHRLVIDYGGRLAGMIQYFEEQDPDYRHAMVDVFIDPSLHGRGIGTDALRQAVAHLVGERGHHRITIDPAADNAPAIHTYGKVGFTPVGTLHCYERNHDGVGWHDCLLMEYVSEGAARAQLRRTTGPRLRP